MEFVIAIVQTMNLIVKVFLKINKKVVITKKILNLSTKNSDLNFILVDTSTSQQQLATIHKYVLMSITVVLLILIFISVILTFLQNVTLYFD